MIVTKDTDLVVIGLSVFFDLKICELWIQYGSGKDKRWIPPLISMLIIQVKKTCRAVPFWYAITGSDSTTQCAGRSKTSSWKTWAVLPELTDVFIDLSHLRGLTDQDKQSIE